MPDNVNHPDHYQGSLECITAIRAALTPEEFRGFCKGNVIKYAWRERNKGQDESLAKFLKSGLIRPAPDCKVMVQGKSQLV